MACMMQCPTASISLDTFSTDSKEEEVCTLSRCLFIASPFQPRSQTTFPLFRDFDFENNAENGFLACLQSIYLANIY